MVLLWGALVVFTRSFGESFAPCSIQGFCLVPSFVNGQNIKAFPALVFRLMLARFPWSLRFACPLWCSVVCYGFIVWKLGMNIKIEINVSRSIMRALILGFCDCFLVIGFCRFQRFPN